MKAMDVLDWAYESVGDNADYDEALERLADWLGEGEVTREQVQQALNDAGLEYMDLPDRFGYATGYKHGFADALRSVVAEQLTYGWLEAGDIFRDPLLSEVPLTATSIEPLGDETMEITFETDDGFVDTTRVDRYRKIHILS